MNVSFFLRRADFMKCKQIYSVKLNGIETQPSWVSLEPQFNTCNDIFQDKTMDKLPCKYPQTIHSKLFTMDNSQTYLYETISIDRKVIACFVRLSAS